LSTTDMNAEKRSLVCGWLY